MDLAERRIVFATLARTRRRCGSSSRFGGARGKKRSRCRNFAWICRPAFQKGIAEAFPQARITFDPFHRMKLLNEAVDTVRREEQKQHPEWKGSRILWLKNEWNHTERQKEVFAALRALDLKTNKAHHLKGVFQDIYACSPEAGGGAVETVVLLGDAQPVATGDCVCPNGEAALGRGGAVV